MTPDQHREKAERIRASAEKIDHSVYEIVAEGAYLSSMHWLNHALHKMEVTAEDHDVVHAEHLSGMDRGKIGALMPEILAALDEMEAFRTRYVRGNVAGGLAAARRALELYDVVREAAMAAKSFQQAAAE